MGMSEASNAVRFSLMAALKQFEAEHVLGRPLGEASSRREEGAQISQVAHMTFAPSDVRSIEQNPGGRVRIEQYAFGLLGPNGPLPLHITQEALSRSQEKDHGMVAFLDLFHHRMASLFYRAWADVEPTAQGGAHRPFAQMLLCLGGMGTEGAQGRGELQESAQARAAGPLGAAVRTAEGLEQLLSSFFQMPIRILPFRGEWLEIPQPEQCRLGLCETRSCLGRGAVLGVRTWQRGHRFEVCIGPVSRKELDRFQPQRPATKQLAQWVQLYTHDEWAWTLRIRVRSEACAGIWLGNRSRLGWSSWLGSRNEIEEAVVLDGRQLLSAAHMAQSAGEIS